MNEKSVNKHDNIQVIENSSDEAQKKIVDDFLEFVVQAESEVKSERDLQMAIDEIELQIGIEKEHLEEKQKKRSPHLAELESVQQELQKYAKLNVFAFNSAKYDMQVIFNPMVSTMERKYPDLLKTLSALKKGNQYFSIQFGNIVFKDLISFTIQTSLDKYMKTWLNESVKHVSYIKITTCN